jgi:regulator of protease activity HflC (stomatin/prohibitin superfamily)
MTKLHISLLVAGLVAILGFVGILFSFTVVDSGERGVQVRLGQVIGTLDPGLHFYNPVTTSVVVMDTRIQKQNVTAGAASKDLQSVEATVALTYRLDPALVEQVYQNLKQNYAETLVAPRLQESIKSATARYTAEELITKRQAVRDEMKSAMLSKLENTGIIVDDFNIVNFDFSQTFNAAIEAKVTAEQNALAAKNKLEQVKYEAQQAIEKAKAEAESIRIQAQAVQQQGGADYVKLQAIAKWNGVLPTQFVPGSAVPFIDLNK